MAKKQRVESPVAERGPARPRSGQSRVFSPFRSVGLVTNGVPCCVSNLGETYVVSTVVGRAVQQFDASNLNLLYMTQPQTAHPIEAITAHFHHLFAVSAGSLIVYRRGRAVTSADIPASGRARQVLAFGTFVCVCYAAGVHVFQWQAKQAQLEHYTMLELPSLLGHVVGVTHPATYVNKIVVATQTCLALFNVKTGKLVHTFDELGFDVAGVQACPVALDVVAAYGTAGDICMFNLRSGRALFSLATGEPISSVSFRSDTGADSAPLLGVGTAGGAVLFYDLDRRRRVQSLRDFARAAAYVTFLPGQAVCVVSSGDNALCELVFDPPLATRAVGAHRARLLRRRGGCSTSPACLAFADTEAHFLFAASQGTLFAFSLRKDSQSRKFGNLPSPELPPITDMAYSIEKSGRWDTIVTAHQQLPHVHTWSASRYALGAHRLATLDGAFATAISTSACGNFCLVGSAAGSVVMYNLQSGLKRMGFAPHAQSVTGLALTPNNALLATGSLDGTLQFFDMRVALTNTPRLLRKLELGSGITRLKYNANAGLVAVSTDSAAIVLVDVSTFKIVREFYGHAGRITDFSFFPSGRMVVSASLDSTLRTYDVPSGVCVDAVKINDPATHLSVSLNSEWISTSHTNGLGVQMWAVKSTLSNLSAVSEVIDITMPVASGETGVGLLETFESAAAAVEGDRVVETGQIGDLATLSAEPRVKFTTLVHLDEIKARNKPVEGPEKPPRAPFFLTAGVAEPATEPDAELDAQAMDIDLSIPKPEVSKFTDILMSEGDVCGYLATLGAAAADLEIRSLDSPTPNGELAAFLRAMVRELHSGRNFELVQAWMAIVFKAHAAELASPDLQPSLCEYEQTLSGVLQNLEDQMRFCAGTLQFLRI